MHSAVSLLAGIPSVVYGLVGMLVLVPGIRKVFDVDRRKLKREQITMTSIKKFQNSLLIESNFEFEPVT